MKRLRSILFIFIIFLYLGIASLYSQCDKRSILIAIPDNESIHKVEVDFTVSGDPTNFIFAFLSYEHQASKLDYDFDGDGTNDSQTITPDGSVIYTDTSSDDYFGFDVKLTSSGSAFTLEMIKQPTYFPVENCDQNGIIGTGKGGTNQLFIGGLVNTYTIAVTEIRSYKNTAPNTCNVPILTTDVTANISPCVAGINASPNTDTPLYMDFSADNPNDFDGTIDAYEWIYDFMGHSTVIDSSHNNNTPFTYEGYTEGTYTVRLRVKDNTGAYSPWVSTVVHTNQRPLASFSASPASGGGPLTVSLDPGNPSDPDTTSDTDPNTTDDTDQSITEYRWDWDGDGTIDIVKYDANEFTHDYSYGSHNTKLIVMDNLGLVSDNDETKTITVSGAPPPGLYITTAANGTGDIIQNYVIEATNTPLSLYSGIYDTNGNFTLVSVDWSVSVPSGNPPVFDDDNISSQHNNVSNISFNPGTNTGVAEITITDGTRSFTGDIFVMKQQEEGTFDVVHVLDHSGSMSGLAYPETGSPTKIAAVKDAADYFVRLMREDNGNRYGLVIFDNIIDTLVPSTESAPLAELSSTTPVGGTKSDILDTIIPGITQRGMTSIGGGLLRGLELLNANNDHNESILLLTDGRHNTSPPISDFLSQYISSSANFPLHIVALGYSGGVDEVRLQNLLDDLDGTHDNNITNANGTYRRIENGTQLPLQIFKVFNDILLESTQANLLTDPIEELMKGDPPIEVPVSLTSDQTSATFSVFWQGADDALNIKLVSPSGKVIDKYTQNNRIRYGEHSNYKFLDILFPLSGGFNSEREGEWKFIISVADHIPENAKIQLTSTVSAMGGATMEAGFSKLSNLTGEPIKVKATLLRDGTPLTGASVNVKCSIPKTSIGNILHDSDLTYDEITRTGIDNEDNSLIERKISLIEKKMGKSLIKRDSDTLTLYDDGKHDDGEANDGVYTNLYTNTTIPGNYNFRFIASDIPIENGKTTTREWNSSFNNEVNTNIKSTKFKISILDITGDGVRYAVKFIPTDRYKNYLGPGYPVTIKAYTANSGTLFTRKLRDNLDGTYATEFLIPSEKLEHKPLLKVLIDEKEFTDKKIPTNYYGDLSIHVGTLIPLDPLDIHYDKGILATLDFGYNISQELTLLGLIDYNHFLPKTSGTDALELLDICFDVKYRYPLLLQSFPVYIIGGIGLYSTDFSSFDTGVNIGGGIEYNLNKNLSFDISGRYHRMLKSQDMFLQVSAGFIWRF